MGAYGIPQGYDRIYRRQSLIASNSTAPVAWELQIMHPNGIFMILRNECHANFGAGKYGWSPKGGSKSQTKSKVRNGEKHDGEAGSFGAS